MEPWPFSHGYRAARPPLHSHYGALQWSHGPSAMDTSKHERPHERASRPFNGAMALQPWIQDKPVAAGLATLVPSMEPWPFSHGYLGLRQQPAKFDTPSMEPWPFSHGYPVCFPPASTDKTLKPSMEPWPFSHGYASWLRCSRSGGLTLQWSHGPSAMDTQRAGKGAGIMTPLQWSHGPSAMDTQAQLPAHPHRVLPSMEPWPFSHGYAPEERRLRYLECPFNGAMALQPWIPGTSHMASRYLDVLQWSHGPSAMDTST